MTKTSTLLLLILCPVMAAFGQGPFSKCDVNHDGSTNVSDVQFIINEAQGTAPAVNDLDANGVVNVVDVQIVITAALGLGCLAAVPYTHVVGSVPASIENSASPVTAGPQTVAVDGVPVSVENSTSPAQAGPQTIAVDGALVSIENSTSPAIAGPQTLVAGGIPFSVLNSVSPARSSPQTYYAAGLNFSIFNGLTPTSLQSALRAPSLRFLVPVDPVFLVEALARGAERIDGKPVCLDSDGDGLCDADELILGTSPFLADTDGDGYPDGLELALGSDPLDPKSIPDIRPPGYFATPPVSIQNMIPVAIVTPKSLGEIHAANNR